MGSSGNQPPFLGYFPKVNSVLKTQLWWEGACYELEDIHFIFRKTISGTEDKRPNLMTKDVSIALITQEIPRILGALFQKLVQRPNIYH